MEALLEGRDVFKARVSANVPDSWPGSDLHEALPFLARVAQGDPEGEWIRLVVHKESNSIIGEIGFMGPPDESGTVEVGYSIIPERRGKAYATEAAATMCEWALGQPGVERLIAECLSDNSASRRVLEKTGFSLVKESEETLYWEKRG